MTLKTSSFKINKTIFKKTVLRFWPIWALYLVIMIFTLPVSLFNNLRHVWRFSDEMIPLSVYEETLNADKMSSLINALDANLVPVLLGIFAIISAVAVFSYLYSARSCNMMHAFPIKRSELFATNYIAGFLFLLVPQIIVFLLTCVVCAIHHVPGIPYVALWLVFVVGMSFFFYSLAVFCCMLTGHFLAGFAFFFLFNLFYMAIAGLLVSLATQICYGVYSFRGLDDLPGMWLSPLVYWSSNRIEFNHRWTEEMGQLIETSGGISIALYCIPAVVLIVVSVLLYQRRHLECAAEMTAHRFVKPMTRWLVTVVGAIGLSFAFATVFFDGSKLFVPVMVLMLILCSWVVFFILEMALNKKFKVFKKVRFAEWGICAIVMLLILGALEMDAFGVEKRVPTVADTKGVIVSANHDMVITDAGQVAQIIEAHQEMITHKKEYEAAGEISRAGTSRVELEYVLNNGKSFVRVYYIPVDEKYITDTTRAAYMIRSLQEENDSAMQSWLAVNYEDMDIIGGTMFCYNKKSVGEQTVTIQKEDMEVLFEAMKKDTLAGNTGRYFGPGIDWDTSSYLNCHINFTAELPEEPISIHDLARDLRDGEQNAQRYSTTVLMEPTASYTYEQRSDGDYIIDGYFDMYTSCEYTLQALLDLGLIEDVSQLLDEESMKYVD